MDAVEVYEAYYRSWYEPLLELLQYVTGQKTKIAIWGGGARGQAFLHVFDRENQYISCVFDINEKLFGSLCCGHPIRDYRESCDIGAVLMMNQLYEAEAGYLLRENGQHAAIIPVDHLILGKLSWPQALTWENKATAKKKDSRIKVAALTILYRDDSAVLQHIRSYAGTVDKLYLFDNNEIQKETKALQEAFPDAVILRGNGNEGIGRAVNEAARAAAQENCTWLITFDQDSVAEKNMIAQMKDYIQSGSFDDSAGMVAPCIRDSNVPDAADTGTLFPFCYWDKVIQSGAMHRLDILEAVGGYDEKLFIDQVDYEYCIRMRQQGYRIIKVNQAILHHNVNDRQGQMHYENGKKIFADKYSPERCYYIIRNNLFCQQRYAAQNPIYALECENNIRTLERTVGADKDSGLKKSYIRQAYQDFSQGKLGKINSKLTVREGGKRNEER